MHLLKQQFLAHISPILLAVGAVAGTATYFTLPWETPLWPAVTAIIISIYLLYKRLKISALVLGFSLFFAIASWQTSSIFKHKYMGKIPTQTTWVTGTVIDYTAYPKRTYFTLENVKLYTTGNPTLQKIRLSVATSRVTPNMQIGHGLAAQALLQKPKPAAFVGEYNSQFHNFFQQIEAKGYVRGEFYSTHIPASKPKLKAKITKIRHQLAGEITAKASPLAAALVTGLRGSIPPTTKDAFKKSGLAHLLAISGLHLGMVGGLIFFALRYLMACWPRLALNYPTKKIAAVAGLTSSFIYMLLAGATIPTVRAFTMVALVFIAVLLNKFKIAIRLWSIAVLIVLAIWPYSVVTASFQMSFIAALALILWVTASDKTDTLSPQRLTYIKGVIVASLVAGLATLPLAAWHFNMVSFTGFFLNLIAIPLMGFWVLPAAVLAFVLMPFGLDFIALNLMQYGLNLLVALAIWGSETSLAGWIVSPHIWPWLGIISAGGILAVITKRFKLAWGSVIALAVLLLVWEQKPVADIILLNNGKTIIICPQASKCSAVRIDKTSKRTAKNFFKFYNLEPTNLTPNCQGDACVYSLKNQKILITPTPPSPEDCHLATLIISPYKIKNCPVETGKTAPSIFINLGQGSYSKTLYIPNKIRLWEKQP